MDRQTVIQFVALLVVVAALVRWLPDEDPLDPLGMGVPWDTLAMERQLLKLGPSTDEAMTFLRVMRTHPERQKVFRRHWTGLVKQLRDAQEGSDHDVLIQFRGIPRNDLWPLMYMAYPHPFTFLSYEKGSRATDELIDGAEQVVSTLVRVEDMPDRQPGGGR
jgi:hypothetical protein